MNNSSKILTGMSHEIRTYMNFIVSYSFLIEEDRGRDSFQAQYGNKIFNTCTQLLSLIENYIQASMIDQGNLELNPKRCMPANIINKLVPVFTEMLERDKCKSIKFINETAVSKMPEIYLDKSKISRVMQNFFQNAVNNMENGYIRTGCFFKGDSITFYILDSRQDFAKAREFLNTGDLDRSLSRYFDATTAINIQLAKKLVNMMGGTIKILPNEYNGTGVYISVPAISEAPAPAVRKESARSNAIWKKIMSLVF